MQPGFIATERIAQDMAKFGFDASAGAPASVIGAVVAWLATDPEAAELNGTTIEAQYFAHERNLVPDWGGPVPGQSIKYDMAAANIADLEDGAPGQVVVVSASDRRPRSAPACRTRSSTATAT